MEEELKILKAEYLSNQWLDFPKILNLSLGDQTKIIKECLKGRRPPTEEDIRGKKTSTC